MNGHDIPKDYDFKKIDHEMKCDFTLLLDQELGEISISFKPSKQDESNIDMWARCAQLRVIAFSLFKYNTKLSMIARLKDYIRFIGASDDCIKRMSSEIEEYVNSMHDYHFKQEK
jgi:hypothetical protein